MEGKQGTRLTGRSTRFGASPASTRTRFGQRTRRGAAFRSTHASFAQRHIHPAQRHSKRRKHTRQ
ncbi:hypothetical protein PsYK624_168090 [Phanerochaete sordida]|uniref:Uncharacterized protein n=1 Tax=Phanerochaete sordida TaxID=48140 RepID=A0A9P3GRI3_9APHY|nr:hypothetical protein PsYK624_168090 [Phanerochaete sordida]